MSTSVPGQTLPPLLRLPTELRILIFKYVFSDVNPVITRRYTPSLQKRFLIVCSENDSYSGDLSYYPHGLVFTNKQIASETLDLFYQQISISFRLNVPAGLYKRFYHTTIPLYRCSDLQFDFPHLKRLDRHDDSSSATAPNTYVSCPSITSKVLPNLRSLIVNCWLGVLSTSQASPSRDLSRDGAMVQRLVYLRRSFDLKLIMVGRFCVEATLKSDDDDDFETHWTSKCGLTHIKLPKDRPELAARWNDTLRKLFKPKYIGQIFESLESHNSTGSCAEKISNEHTNSKFEQLNTSNYDVARTVIAPERLDDFETLWRKRYSA